MEPLQLVKRLQGSGLTPGYRTRNALGIGSAGRRGLRYPRRFSRAAPAFGSESVETQTALTAVGQAVTSRGVPVPWPLDSGCDGVAVWAPSWGQGQPLVGRVKHRDRLVQPAPDGSVGHLAERAVELQPLATVAAELVGRKVGQPRE